MLVSRLGPLLRDQKKEALNNSVLDTEPDEIMRAMQRVCRMWYVVITPMLYEDSIFGLRYLSPPIRHYLHLLSRDEFAPRDDEELDSVVGKHPIEWPLWLRTRAVLRSIKRLRYSRHYKGSEYNWTQGDIWPAGPMPLQDCGRVEVIEWSIEGMALDSSNSSPYFDEDHHQVGAMRKVSDLSCGRLRSLRG